MNDEIFTLGLAGNPNVGKSTVFNALTGLKQHTGNWTGKTVSTAIGKFKTNSCSFNLVDLPGIYSLDTASPEEEIAKDYIVNSGANGIIAVCDATCLERNLNLILQMLEITPNVVVCLNLMDEAKKKNIEIDVKKLASILKIPVVPCAARSKKGLDKLCEEAEKMCRREQKIPEKIIIYPEPIENAVRKISEALYSEEKYKRSQALDIIKSHGKNGESYSEKVNMALKELLEKMPNPEEVIKSLTVLKSEAIAAECVKTKENYNRRDRILDKYLTGKFTGLPIMLILLFSVLWITISGANYPSEMLYDFFFSIESHLTEFFMNHGLPLWLHGILISGVYRVLAWVVSVMLPPMAIFFPLFTLLEDFGYLPRVAFNLDKSFEKAGSSGKQSLTMCMGLGCNAVGVTGCRIINSPRERLIGILTNNFMPCNGRFPILIAVSTMFFGGLSLSAGYSRLLSAAVICGVIVSGIILTFIVSKILSKTILKGIPSSFALEMPPYRAPQAGKVIVRSIFDRTLFVLGRAMIVAAPAGLIIWLAANINIGNTSILTLCADFLDPFAKLFGLDGIILIAFILGFPANEIVVPIMIMAYTCSGILVDYESLDALKMLFADNGWTIYTAISVLIFTICHWPCSTVCLTIKKETGSKKWTFLSMLIPTVTGLLLCFIFNLFVKFIF